MSSALLADLRSAAAALRRAPGFAAVAIVTLGGGLALCVLLLTIANAYVLATLPYPAADRLYSVRYAAPGQEWPARLEDLAWDSLSDVVEQRLAWDLDVFYLRGGPHPEAAPGAWVTPGFVAGFGMRPAMGRGFEAADFEAGRPQVALISHKLWTTRFGATPAIVGHRVEAYVSDRPEEAETFTIVGVLPRDLWHLNHYTEVLAPLRAPSVPYIVRLRPGVPPALAADRITRLVQAGGATLPPAWRAELIATQDELHGAGQAGAPGGGRGRRARAPHGLRQRRGDQLLRVRKREREMAVRLALGASLSRVARLVVFEALIVGPRGHAPRARREPRRHQADRPARRAPARADGARGATRPCASTPPSSPARPPAAC